MTPDREVPTAGQASSYMQHPSQPKAPSSQPHPAVAQRDSPDSERSDQSRTGQLAAVQDPKVWSAACGLKALDTYSGPRTTSQSCFDNYGCSSCARACTWALDPCQSPPAQVLLRSEPCRAGSAGQLLGGMAAPLAPQPHANQLMQAESRGNVMLMCQQCKIFMPGGSRLSVHLMMPHQAADLSCLSPWNPILPIVLACRH